MKLNLSASTSRPRWSVLLVDVALATVAFVFDGLGSSGTTRSGAALPLWGQLAPAAVGAVALLVRRSRPWPVFAVWWVIGLEPLVIVGREQFAGLLIALATVAACTTRTASVLAAALALIPMELNAYGVYRQQPGQFTTLGVLELAFVWMALTAAAVGVGRVIYLLRERVELLHRLHAVELSSVIRGERLRLARDLHDIVAHSVSAMILQAAGARSLSDTTDIRIRTALRSVELTGADAMKELHRLLGLLRESGSHETPDLVAQPGLENIDQILTTTRACGVEVELVETGVPHKLDAEVSYTAFRMVQECMANVIKHGGAGARSTVDIDWHDDGLDITVRNDEHDAVSATMLSGGYGLRGLTERVAEVGGQFAAGPAEESIFVASMSLPFRLAAAPASGG